MTYEPCGHLAAVILWTVSKTVSARFSFLCTSPVLAPHTLQMQKSRGGFPPLQLTATCGDGQYPVA